MVAQADLKPMMFAYVLSPLFCVLVSVNSADPA